MKEIVFDKKKLKSYKDFYHEICIKLEKDKYIDWNGEYEDLEYNADLLNEFLWYTHNCSNKFIFTGFDLEKIEKQRTYENYEWGLIFKVMNRFVKEYPNNSIEFRDE